MGADQAEAQVLPLAGPPAAPPPKARLSRSARRLQLLDAAQEVFVSAGYHAASMDDIAERAGVSKPVLYQHFPSKLDLYLALLGRHADSLVADVRSALARTSDNRERVLGSVQAYVDFVEHEGAAWRLVFESDVSREPLVAERVRRMHTECVEAIASTIAADTGLSDAEALLLSIGLAGVAEAGAKGWLAAGGSRGPVPKDRAVALLARLTWRGIAGFPGPADRG